MAVVVPVPEQEGEKRGDGGGGGGGGGDNGDEEEDGRADIGVKDEGDKNESDVRKLILMGIKKTTHLCTNAKGLQWRGGG